MRYIYWNVSDYHQHIKQLCLHVTLSTNRLKGMRVSAVPDIFITEDV